LAFDLNEIVLKKYGQPHPSSNDVIKLGFLFVSEIILSERLLLTKMFGEIWELTLKENLYMAGVTKTRVREPCEDFNRAKKLRLDIL